MAAPNQPTATTAQPPPDVPSDPAIGDRLGNYLRQFALWTRRGFAAKIDNGVAQAGLYFLQSGVVGIPNVYRMTVTVSGTTPQITLTPVTLGSGIAGGPVTMGAPELLAAPTNFIFSPDTGWGTTTVSNPAGTVNSTYTMMGMNLVLPPIVAANALWVTLDGQITNSSNNSETDVVICYGTGTPPVNGAAQTGTIVGQPARYKATAGGDYTPFSLSSLITPVTKGTVYWIDCAVRAINGGTASILDVDFNAFGIA
jgi:hypothetical protein